MRRLLLTALLLPLFSISVSEPVRRSSGLPAQSPIPVKEGFTPGSPAAGVLLFPLAANDGTFRLTSIDAGVAFDIDGDDALDQVAWTEAGADVAFLAMDINDDGRIRSGKELFGSHMVPDVTNGCNALLHVFRATGAPLSGSVHAGHTLYEQLVLWVDRNHNGISESAELRPAREAFTAIGMGYTRTRWSDAHGNSVRFEGWAERRTAGPEQGKATLPGEHQSRLRRYFEVTLTMR